MATNTELNIIVILEDEPTDAELVERALRKGNLKFTTRRAENKAGFVQVLDESKPDIVLSDYKLPDFNGLAAVKAGPREVSRRARASSSPAASATRPPSS